MFFRILIALISHGKHCSQLVKSENHMIFLGFSLLYFFIHHPEIAFATYQSHAQNPLATKKFNVQENNPAKNLFPIPVVLISVINLQAI